MGCPRWCARPRRGCAAGATGRRRGRPRRALSGTVGVDVGPIAGDHLHAGVVAQPSGEGAGVAVGQQIHDLAALEVDQDRAVAAALAPRPLVHPEHARRRRLGACRRFGEPQERVGAGGHRETRREPGSRLAAKGEGDLALDVGEALAAPGEGTGDAGQPLGEGPPRAGGLGAEEAPRPDPDGHGTTLPGQVGEAPLVAAVHARGGGATVRARRGGQAGSGDDGDAVRLGQDLLDDEPAGDQREEALGHSGFGAAWNVRLMCSSAAPWPTAATQSAGEPISFGLYTRTSCSRRG